MLKRVPFSCHSKSVQNPGKVFRYNILWAAFWVFAWDTLQCSLRFVCARGWIFFNERDPNNISASEHALLFKLISRRNPRICTCHSTTNVVFLYFDHLGVPRGDQRACGRGKWRGDGGRTNLSSRALRSPAALHQWRKTGTGHFPPRGSDYPTLPFSTGFRIIILQVWQNGAGQVESNHYDASRLQIWSLHPGPPKISPAVY